MVRRTKAWARRWLRWFAPTRTDRIALGLFGAFVVVAFPLILFRLGEYHWFLRDDFEFLSERNGRWPEDVWAPHGGSHWSTVPKLVYVAMWQIVGMRSYVPYQAMVVALHLTCCLLLVIVMRRSRVSGPIAAAAGAAMVLFGPGAQNIVWAFQIGMVGSLVFGLVHLLLADHGGPVRGRDGLGLAFGLLGLMSSGVSIPMVGVVGLTLLIARGWRRALLHTVPLAVVFGVWALLADPSTTTPFGRPTPGRLLGWLWATISGVFTGIGGWPVVGAFLGLTTVVGLVLLFAPGGSPGRLARLRIVAAPVSLFAGSIAFAASTGLGRWYLGDEFARSGRYLHVGAALTLPLIAVGAQSVARRWRWFTPLVVAALLVPIPFGLDRFEEFPFGRDYMERRQYLLTTAVRMPFAGGVPGDVQPAPDPFSGTSVTMDFLLAAERNGDLVPSTVELTPEVLDEFRVRLGVVPRPTDRLPTGCEVYRGLRKLTPDEGQQVWLSDKVQMAIRDGDEQVGPWVNVDPTTAGHEITFELPKMQLYVRPMPGAPSATYQICDG